MSADVGRVLVTGASGFIARHVIQQLLQAGHQVRGTVRSLEDEAKVKAIQDLVPEAAGQLELVEGDLLDASSWEGIVADCSHVLHIATPLPASAPRNEDEVTKPAVEGTLSVLQASAKSGTVKRVILTSSVAAISGGLIGGKFTEENWPDLTQGHVKADAKAKVMAEKSAWDFVKELPEEEKFELVTLNPSMVIGPTLGGNMSFSLNIGKELLINGITLLPRASLPIVDVRDVATAHVRAMKNPDVAGLRIIVTAGNLWFRELAQYLQEEFGPQGYQVPQREGPNFIMKFMSVFYKDLKPVTCALDQVTEYDNTRMTTILGITPIDMRESVIDMGSSLIEVGFVPKKQKAQEQEA